MNIRMTVFIISKMLGVEGALLLIPAFVALLYREESALHFAVVSGFLFLIFLLAGRKKPGKRRIYKKEGLIIVGSAWILWSLFGALPFFLSGSIPSYLDAFFETVSGFTTTGSTILTDIEALPRGMAFWRSLTHWIGGMGVLVFVMMLTSLDDENSMHLMRAEVPGPTVGKLVSRLGDTAKILYGIYLAMTVLETVLLLAGGMQLFDAVTLSMGTAGTGGFQDRAGGFP